MQIHSQISVDGQARRIWTNCQEKRTKHSREFSARASVDTALRKVGAMGARRVFSREGT